MTVRDWEVYFINGSDDPRLESGQAFRGIAYNQSVASGIGPINSGPNMLFLSGVDPAYIRPINGRLNGHNTLGFNEGIMEIYYLTNGVSAGSVYLIFKATDTTNYYLVEWQGAGDIGPTQGAIYLKRVKNGGGLATLFSDATPDRTPRERQWNFMRVYWFKPGPMSLSIRLDVDNNDGNGLTTLFNYTDSSPVADSSTCNIGLGGHLNSGPDNSYYFDALRLRPRPVGQTF